MHYKHLCGPHSVAWWLLFIGGLNWGLVGVFKWDLVEALLGTWPLIVKIVYILVGLSALFMLLSGKCKACKM